MRVKDEDPILQGKALRAVSGGDVSHVYYADTTTAAPVYIASTGTTLATAPLTTNGSGYVVDANAARVWYEEGAYDRVVDGETHTIHAVHGNSPGGRELASAATTVDQSGITTPVDLTNLTITFTVAYRPVIVYLHLSDIRSTAAGGAANAYIIDSSNSASTAFGGTAAATASPFKCGGVALSERIAAQSTPTTFTRKAQAQFAVSGTVTVKATATAVARIWAEEK